MNRAITTTHTDADISLLLEDLEKGKILIPSFQREFVWDRSDIRDFYDSLLKGYTVGSLILWHPDEEKFNVLGDIEGIKVGDFDRPALYVLDGRQRLTALLTVLHPQGTNYDKFWLNLKDDTVEYSASKKQGHHYLRIGTLFSTFGIVEFLSELRAGNLPESIKSKYAEKVKNYNSLLLRTKIAYVTLNGGSIKEAVEVFSRLNSKGVGISSDYMMQALAYDGKSDFRLAASISEIIQGLEPYNFAGIKRDIVFNCLYNYLDIPYIDGTVAKLTDRTKDLPGFVEAMKRDIRKTVEFLYHNCGVIDSRLLPYSSQFVIIADFFRLNPEPSEASLKELKKWFYYTTYTNYFTSHSLTETRNDIRQFREFAKGSRMTALDYQDAITISEPKNCHLGNVRTKAYVMSLFEGREVPLDAKLIVEKIFTDVPKSIENCAIGYERKEVDSQIEEVYYKGNNTLPTRRKSLLDRERKEIEKTLCPVRVISG